MYMSDFTSSNSQSKFPIYCIQLESAGAPYGLTLGYCWSCGGFRG